MERFYSDLVTFDTFEDVGNLAAYSAVPDDWVVLITDIRGSTRAINEGRYKDVNMLGAASISAVLNECGDIEVPFSFGGDGATLVVPATLAEVTTSALVGLRRKSKGIFGLELRVGAVPVRTIHHRGATLLVRKYSLSPGNHLAMFAGGGMELVDELLKGDSAHEYEPEDSPDADDPDLEGLSCRWSPLSPKGDKMVAIMVRSLVPGQDDIGEMMQSISGVLGCAVKDAAPANPVSMRFRWPPEGLSLEARATAGKKSFLRHYLSLLLGSFYQLLCERFNIQLGDYNPQKYHQELRSNTDFQKFDGTLKLVLDLTLAQTTLLEQWLEQQFQLGKLVYGLHAANTALMTCLLFNLKQGEHLHFVDSGDGGYAMAAVGFKQRSKAALEGSK